MASMITSLQNASSIPQLVKMLKLNYIVRPSHAKTNAIAHAGNKARRPTTK